MCHKTIHLNNYKPQGKTYIKVSSQRGSSLVLAIFIIVVMSLLGASLMRMMSSSAETFAYEVLGTRAYAAAQTGLQWRLKSLFPLGSPAVVCPPEDTDDPSAGAPDLSGIKGLKGCRIATLVCSCFAVDGTRYYTITSTGQCDINGEKTSRTLKVQARSL
ncbi:MAG: pilus assembly PilX N-terminal domain-containing protein [Alteromonadaceae bacterium]|nr:pilus assembly PilX N-terminal domain-containing protein [Alteromonadaceae bacterium]